MDVYCYLHARFGPPNGMMMLAAPPSPDNIFHWHFQLVSGDDLLHVHGVSARVEFLAFAAEQITDEQWVQLLNDMKGDFANHGAQIRNVRHSLERWTVFVNPYFRLERIVADSHARLDDLDLSGDLKESPEREDDFASFQALMDQLGQNYSQAAELGTSLRMITPIWAESFVNLLIFLLAKPDVRANSRLYDDLLRKEIDVRIVGMHLHCDGFVRPLDRSSDQVRDLLTVMNSRNDLLHGNVDPKKLAIDEVYFNGNMPLFKRCETITERAMVPKLKLIEPEAVKLDICRVEAFIAYVLDQLEPAIKVQVRAFMENEFPGWRADTGRPGLLFSDVIVDFSIPLPGE